MLHKIRLSMFVLVASVAISACAGSGPIGEDPGVAVAELSALPVPGPEDYASTAQGDVARPLDVLNVAVFGVPDLSRTVRVGSGGFFDFPLIGAVQANGRALSEISYEIETRLSGDFVRNPDVTVEFEQREGQVFTIGGQVGAPGQYPIIQPTTLMEAMAIGGGQTEYSQLNEVLIFREIAGQRYIGVYDVKAIQRGNYPDPTIYAHDVIMVGDSPNRRLIAEVLRYTQLITSPLILVDRVVR